MTSLVGDRYRHRHNYIINTRFHVSHSPALPSSHSAKSSVTIPAKSGVATHSAVSSLTVTGTAHSRAVDKCGAEALFNNLTSTLHPPGKVQKPLVIRDIRPHTWQLFKDMYAEYHGFSSMKFEYIPSHYKVTVLALPTPFHDIAVSVMAQHVHGGMRDARLDTSRRINTIKVNRENFEKSTATGISQREPDCAVWTPDYEDGIVPTIVWEVGHTQKRLSLIRRAKMWARRYNGKVQAIILVKYTCRNPRIDPSSILLLYRPFRRADGKWTAVQDGPVYSLFPRPVGVVEGEFVQGDVVPLLYEDYFGVGNVGVGVDPKTRFDLPLELVREFIMLTITAEGKRRGFRFVSGGSSVGGEGGQELDNDEEPEEEEAQETQPVVEEKLEDERRESPTITEYEQFGNDWDDAMSDVSVDP